MGLRSVTLGHAYAPVVEAAIRQMQLGTNFNRPAPIEVECAEALLGVLPQRGDGEVREGRFDGGLRCGEARARSYRPRQSRDLRGPSVLLLQRLVLVTTGIPGGIPAEASRETVSFRYNDLAGARKGLRRARGRHCLRRARARPHRGTGRRISAPVAGLAHRHGALFILDETVAGFRWALGGGQEVYDVQPDLAAFGKALGNGFAVSALTGRREFMQLGGLQHARERVFLLSTTHGAETHALAAAVKVIEIYRREDVIGALDRQGRRLESGVRQAIAHHGLERHFTLAGRPCAMLYGTRDAAGQPSAQFRTLFLQELIRRGVLAPSFMVSYSHDDATIDRTIESVAGALEVYRQALDGGVERHLVGPSVKSVYRRFN